MPTVYSPSRVCLGLISVFPLFQIAKHVLLRHQSQLSYRFVRATRDDEL